MVQTKILVFVRNYLYHCKPHFSLYIVGFKGCSLHGLVNVMTVIFDAYDYI